MSKEMTPKEAFKALADKKIIENAIGEYNTIRETFEDECVTIEQALTELEELKRYPTAEEVCEVLSKELEDSVILFYGDFVATNKNRVVASKFDDGEILTQISLPPHLTTLIGRFYEGVGEE